jgi:hypothetical protein
MQFRSLCSLLLTLFTMKRFAMWADSITRARGFLESILRRVGYRFAYIFAAEIGTILAVFGGLIMGGVVMTALGILLNSEAFVTGNCS